MVNFCVVFIWLPLFATEIIDMTHSVSLFITCSVKRYFLELFLNALKFCLNLMENVCPVGPVYFTGQSEHFN